MGPSTILDRLSNLLNRLMVQLGIPNPSSHLYGSGAVTVSFNSKYGLMIFSGPLTANLSELTYWANAVKLSHMNTPTLVHDLEAQIVAAFDAQSWVQASHIFSPRHWLPPDPSPDAPRQINVLQRKAALVPEGLDYR